MSASVPTPLGVVKHYNLLERLEPSGPGELYRARDTRLGRTVTVRLLPADYPRDTAGRERLLESVRALTVVSHPNVTALFDAGEHEGRLFLVFEFLKGQSLRAEAAGRPMNVRRAVEPNRALRYINAGHNPPLLLRVDAGLGMTRAAVYGWLAKYREGGLEALKARPVPGRPPTLSGAQLQRIYALVVGNDPRQLQFTGRTFRLRQQ